MTTPSRKVFSPRLFCCLVVTITLFTLAAGTAVAKPQINGGCPSVKAIGNFLPSNDGLAADFSDDGAGNVTYTFTSNDESPIDGVPGLIQYCVYPDLGTEPNSATAVAVGANGDAWVAGIKPVLGWFAFGRPDGNPSNIPFDGSLVTVGEASWGVDPITLQSLAPAVQTILLHINDADECQALYGGTSNTCFVFPGGGTPPGCTEVACKDVVITDAVGNIVDPNHLQLFTDYFLTYDYLVQNVTTSYHDSSIPMTFKFPPSKTDVNNGGFKDYFGCEQIPDPTGQPGTWGLFFSNQPEGGLTWVPTFTADGWKLNFAQGGGTCNQSRFFGTPYQATIKLGTGEEFNFTIDMHLRQNKGKKQEFTSCGPHFLNSGFTVKWLELISDGGDGSLHSFTTNPQLSVNVDCP